MIVEPGSEVSLSQIPTRDPDAKDKEAGRAEVEENAERIAELQARLFAENRRALLVVLQGMDTSGKDGAVRRVFARTNPMGMQCHAFGPPSEEERDHDFLWRVALRLPRYGNLGVWNRSHYEDVLVVRVRQLQPEAVWRPRFDKINHFEQYVTDGNTRLLKIMLHISKQEQKRRLQARLDEPEKRWKFQMGDLEDRKLWPSYMRAYEEALELTSTPWAPWHIIPADQKWQRDVLVSRLVRQTLESMEPVPPKVRLPRGLKIN